MPTESNETTSAPILPLTQQSWHDGTVPVVSVFSWVYNHSQFVRQSIESILAQETDFPVEIILHDDASTDGTREIIAEYVQRYPRLFRNVMQVENQYSQGKCLLRPLLSVPLGQFIALTHGDDFWAHPRKLMLQKKLMETKPDVVLCGHRFRLVGASSSDEGPVSEIRKEEGDIKDILLLNYIHTATAMFRNGVLKVEDLRDPPESGDWFIWVQLLKHGKAGFINEVMSGYRIHAGGLNSGTPLRGRLRVVTASVERMHRDFGLRYFLIKQRSLALYRLHLACQCPLGSFADFLWLGKLLLAALLMCPLFSLRQADCRVVFRRALDFVVSRVWSVVWMCKDWVRRRVPSWLKIIVRKWCK